jgi:hypothetical protein
MTAPTNAEIADAASQAEWLRWLIEDSLLLTAREKQRLLQELAHGAYSEQEQAQLRAVLLEEVQMRDRIRKER